MKTRIYAAPAVKGLTLQAGEYDWSHKYYTTIYKAQPHTSRGKQFAALHNVSSAPASQHGMPTLCWASVADGRR